MKKSRHEGTLVAENKDLINKEGQNKKKKKKMSSAHKLIWGIVLFMSMYNMYTLFYSGAYHDTVCFIHNCQSGR